MTYPEFKSKWLTKRVDYDGVYQYQCVDLVKQYLNECFGLSPGSWGDAIDYWNNPNITLLNTFDKVEGTQAQQGDIVVIRPNHIGIVEDSNDTSIYTLEQNGKTGNGSGVGGDAIRLRWIPTSTVAGLLRPKTQGKKMDYKAAETLLVEGYLGIVGVYPTQDQANEHIPRMMADPNYGAALIKQLRTYQPKDLWVKTPPVVVQAPVDEKQVVQNVLVRFWNSLFKKG